MLQKLYPNVNHPESNIISVPEKDTSSPAQTEDKIVRIRECNLKAIAGSNLIPMNGIQHTI